MTGLVLHRGNVFALYESIPKRLYSWSAAFHCL